MVLKGYEGAFITAYKSGARIPIESLGATPVDPKKKEDLNETPTKTQSVVDRKLVVFKVQVGIYKDAPPADMEARFRKEPNLIKEKTITGLTRYIVGEFNDYEAASNLKKEVSARYPDPFVIAFFNGQYITVQEALELLK